jgi:beta-fructofuranosidase
VAPDENQFDNRAFYAAKSASDGSRRFLFGWNPSKVEDADNGDWQWGGCLTVHEIIQNEDGMLSVRMPPEVDSAFGSPSTVGLDHAGQGWNLNGNTRTVKAPYGYSMALSQPMPETYLLQGELNFERDEGTAGILLRVDDQGDTGYFLRFNRAGQRLEFGKVGGYRSWYVDHMPELDRPLNISAGEALHFKILIDKTAVVAYVNDQIALSGRMYSNPFGRCGLFADGTDVSVNGFELRTLSAKN